MESGIVRRKGEGCFMRKRKKESAVEKDAKTIRRSVCLTLLIVSFLACGCGRQPDTEKKEAVRQESAARTDTDFATEDVRYQTEPESGENPHSEAVSFADAGISDGEYSFTGTLKGGSGRASFDGPLTLTVKDGKGTLTFTMSSDHYDYVKVDGRKFEPVNTGGNSTFTVPIEGVDYDFSFIGDTLAMSRPYEIDYSVRIDSASLRKSEPEQTES